MTRMEPTLVKVAGGLDFPEGPAYDGKGNLYCSNCDGGYISKLAPDGGVSVAYRPAMGETPFTFHKPNGMTFSQDGSLWICDFGRNAIVQIHPDGRQEMVADRCEGKPFRGPNDLAFDPKGNLYFTDPTDSGRDHPIGPVYRVEHATRKVTKVADGMAFPNGLAFTADAKFLYVCESQHNRILRFAVHPDGGLGSAEPFVDLASVGAGEPDGMAVDAQGHLWIAHYGAHHVVEVDAHSKIMRVIPMPVDKEGGPTNIEFGGHDLRTVYVTDPSTNALYRFRAETPGIPLFYAPKNVAAA